MNREQKAATIDALAIELRAAETIIAVDYRGLSVSAAAQLRARLRNADASFRVVKNSLTERAADQAGVEALKVMLEGPTALTFVRGDAALAAKAIADQARASPVLSFKGGVMGSEALDPEQMLALSRLPSREALYGQLVGVVSSPIGGLVRTLNALISGLAVALGQVREQKEQEAPAPAVPDSGEAAPSPPEREGRAEEPAGGEPEAEQTEGRGAAQAVDQAQAPAEKAEAAEDQAAAAAAVAEAPGAEVEAPADQAGAPAEPAEETEDGAET
jgi:large subunit ribosomal protein L10